MEKQEEESNKVLRRRKRNEDVPTPKPLKKLRKRSKVKVKFMINGKVTEVTKIRHISIDKFYKIHERLSQVDLLIKKNETVLGRLSNAKYFIDLHLDGVVAVCENGSVNRKNKCGKPTIVE